jgi:hypothetical protein
MTIKPSGKGFALFSKDGNRKLSRTYKSPKDPALLKREKQVTFFKNNEQYIKDHGTAIPRKPGTTTTKWSTTKEK